MKDEFRSKVACHNDVAQLECNPYSRIAIYSASFGRTEYESIQCPQPQGVREETCLAAYATETVMQICHGRRRCNLAADPNTFGSPCQQNSRMYLKVVYTCVPKQVLKERYESETEADELEEFEGDINELYDDEMSYKESEAIPKLYSNITTAIARINVTSLTNLTNAITANNTLAFEADTDGTNPVKTHSSDLTLEDDQERLFFYLLILGGMGVIVCVVAVATRTIIQKKNATTTDTESGSSMKSSGNHGETTIPNGFNDNISEIDADIDLTTAIPVPSVSKNENFLTSASSNCVYGNLVPTSISQNSVLIIPENISGKVPHSLITNPLVYGARDSPDLIGISSNPGLSIKNGDTVQTSFTNVSGPTIVIGNANSTIATSTIYSPLGSSMGAVLPITSLGQYTTAPTIRAGYMLNADTSYQRQCPANSPQKSFGNSSGECFNSQIIQQAPLHYQLTQVPLGSSVNQQFNTSTLQRNRTCVEMTSQLQHQLSYDGIAPRTDHTGVSINSKYYYG